jgi:hypothetical protein
MKKLLCVFSAFAFLICFISFQAEANLVVNGGFEEAGEQGYTQGWTVDWNDNIFGTTDNPHSGSHAARCFWDGGMYQDIPVVVGTEYKFRAYLYTPSGGDTSSWGNYVGFYWMDDEDNLILPLGALWECNITTSLRDTYLVADSDNLDDPAYWMTAPDGATKARVRFGVWQTDADPANPCDFDDFYFDAVPEPGSLLLLFPAIIRIAVLFIRKR